MRDFAELAPYRVHDPLYQGFEYMGGIFSVPSPSTGATLRVIASRGFGWDHVSVSTKRRCPNWPEMSLIKRLFFRDDETAMQLHVPVAEHVNNHPFCLHLWRPYAATIPMPPAEFVGVRDLTPAQVEASSREQRTAVRIEVARRFFGPGGDAARHDPAGGAIEEADGLERVRLRLLSVIDDMKACLDIPSSTIGALQYAEGLCSDEAVRLADRREDRRRRAEASR